MLTDDIINIQIYKNAFMNISRAKWDCDVKLKYCWLLQDTFQPTYIAFK